MTKLDIETIKKVRNYWDVKYKTALLWGSFTPEKRDLEWYKKNTPHSSPFVDIEYYD